MAEMQDADQHAAYDQTLMAAPVPARARAPMAGIADATGIHRIEVEGASCMVRDRPVAATRRTTLLLRRGTPEQSRNWFAGAGWLGPVVVVGMEPWTTLELDFARAAEAFIRHLDLAARRAELCLAGGSGGSFSAMILGAHLAERLPGITVKVVAFSLVTWLYCRDETGQEHYWPYMIADFMNRPRTLAGMRRYAEVAPHLIRAMHTPGVDLRVKAFTTPISPLDFAQLSHIADLACVRSEDVLTDDYNHDMMAWTVMPARDRHLIRQKLMQWMKTRNPNWPQRTLETRVERETDVALAWRRRYPDLASIFEGF